MKTILMIAMLLTGFNTLAQPAPTSTADANMGRGIHRFQDAEIGDIEIKVADIGEGYDILNVTVLCTDRRRHKTAVAPKWEKIPELTNLAICLYRPRPDTLDSAKKELNVHYSMSSLRSLGHFECNNHVRTVVDLVKWCSPWR